MIIVTSAISFHCKKKMSLGMMVFHKLVQYLPQLLWVGYLLLESAWLKVMHLPSLFKNLK